MTQAQEKDVIAANLHMLSAIRLGLEQDRVGTSCRFGLDSALADQLRALGHDELCRLVDQIGHTTLFPPRSDLLSLLRAPTALRSTLATVHAPRSCWPSREQA